MSGALLSEREPDRGARGGASLWPRLALCLVISLALGAYVGARWQLTTDLADFMPRAGDAARAELSRAVAKSELSRTLILSVQGGSPERSAAASRRLEQALHADVALMAELAFLEGGPPEQLQEALWGIYQSHRLAFAARGEQQARQLVSDAGLERAARDMRRRLGSPLSTLVSRAAPLDPLLAVPRLLEDVQRGPAELRVEQGRYLAADGSAILLLGARSSAFDAAAQDSVLAAVDLAVSRVRADWPGVVVEQSGLSRFSVSARRSITADISRIGALSIACLTLLCLLLFRSLRLLLLTLVPVGFGMLAGVSALLLLSGRVHGLTLAFGASLIGVCVDYVIHFYVHQQADPEPGGPRATMRRILPGLLLGAATTVIGFAAMAGSNFPGLREAAIFGAVGVFAALWVTVFLVPELAGHRARPAAVRDALGRVLLAAFAALTRRRRLLWAVAAAALAASTFGGLRVHWDDDMANLMRFDPSLYEEDQRVRERVAGLEASRFVVALGDTRQQALHVNEAVQRALSASREGGELEGFRGLGALLPSAQTQRAVEQVLRSADLERRLATAFEAAGFDVSVFAPFFEQLHQPPAEPLRYEDLMASPAAPLVRPFLITVGDRVGVISFLRKVVDEPALLRRLDAIEGAELLDQRAVASRAAASYRARVVNLLCLGLAAVLALLWLRYRALGLAVAALSPALLAAGVTVFALSVAGVALNLLGLTSLLMVLSIGVDYGVFLSEARGAGGERGLSATLTGLVVACLSTVFGFGMLALSAQPAMRMIGLVAGVGVSASLLLSPITLVLFAGKQGSHG